jgi:hypothetical protein
LTGALEPAERKGGRTPRKRSQFRAADSIRPDLPEAAHFGSPPAEVVKLGNRVIRVYQLEIAAERGLALL